MEDRKTILEARTPSRKLGVKYLDDGQLTNSFPDWKALLARIEEQRQIAEFSSKKCCQHNEDRFPLAYDNLFAVLGGRGSGKSSVILTLREKMKRPEQQDILLPIITPEIISEKECSILGWIMSATESVIEDLEQRIDKLGQSDNSCQKTPCWGQGRFDDFFKDCHFKKDNPLRQHYNDLFEKSVSTSGKLDTTGYSMEDAMGYRVGQSRKQYKLIRDLNNFWNELTDRWYCVRLQEAERQKGYERAAADVQKPLIVLMFDDIDLVPERSMELLTTTFQYFTNPNIVIILTASEKVLKDVIRQKMFERMVSSESVSLLPWRYEKSGPKKKTLNKFDLDPIEQMAQEFYDKVIPSSSRYRLNRYKSIREKRMYAYSSTEQSFWAPQEGTDISIGIELFLSRQIEILNEAFSRKKEDDRNFLMVGRNKKVFQKAYLIIFGEKSRNIANSCLEIMNTVNRLTMLDARGRELTEGEHREVLLALRHLMRALFISNPILKEYADLENEFLYPAPDRVGNYVDYTVALEYYEKEKQDVQDWMQEQQNRDKVTISPERLIRLTVQYLGKAQKKIAALMMVLFFVEGILVVTDSRRRHIHGYRQLSQLMNSDAIIAKSGHNYRSMVVTLFPRHQETRDFLYSSPLVLEHLNRYVGINRFDAHYARDYLEDVFRERLSNERTQPKTILKQAIGKDPDWVKTVLSMLAVRYSGITLVESDFIHFSDEAQRKLNLFSFTTQFEERKRQAAQTFLGQKDLIAYYKEQMSEFEKLTQNSDNWADTATQAKLFDTSFELGARVTPIQVRDEQYSNFLERHDENQDFIKSYFSDRWRIYIDSENDWLDSVGELTPSVTLCYQLVSFVRDTLTSCVSILTSQTDIYLAKDQIEEMLVYLNSISDNNQELKRKKDVCISLLKRGTRPHFAMQIDLEEPTGQTKLPTNGRGGELVRRIPAGPLIEYLAGVQEYVLKSPLELADSYFFDRGDSDSYFELLKFLAVVHREDNSDGETVIPKSGLLILDLRMLEFLFPYYFAAHMGIALDSLYQGELLPHSYDTPYKTEKPDKVDRVDEELQKLFELLTKDDDESKPVKTDEKKLRELMKEAQRELARDYYSYLEDANG